MSTTESFAPTRLTLSRSVTSFLVVALESIAIVSASLLAGTLYSYAVYDHPGDIVTFLGAGVLVAWGFALPFVMRDEYRIEALLEGQRSIRRMLTIWVGTILMLPLIGFLTKSAELYSRGWLLLFFVAGFLAVISVNAILRHFLAKSIENGRIERRRLMVVSVDQDVRMTARELMGSNSCSEVAAVVKLESPAEGSEGFKGADLENAVSWARSLNIDDIVVLADWSKASNIDQLVNAFSILPSAVHVGAASVVGKFSHAHVSRVGGTHVLSLKGQPLQPGQALVKRAFDIIVAGLALVLLSPVFAGIALAIRFDSKGPALFLQRRRGYNQRIFQIWKFRTMTVMDDGDSIVQAKRNDTRVTRVGKFLRRYNLDELPQLINVLRGEMSLVGPRPHAVAHDRMYETVLEHYQRRLNMRPGITGWAQVNGARGETATDKEMAKRLEFDLHYIDNWSLGMDFYILALTVLSPRAYRNAH